MKVTSCLALTEAVKQPDLTRHLTALRVGEFEVAKSGGIWVAIRAGDARIYADKFELYESWAQEKLKRDFSVERWVPRGFENIRLLVATLMDLMSVVAARMHGLLPSHGEAVEYIDEVSVRQLAASAFAGPVQSELYTTTAFLDPLRIRAFGNLRLRFFHKSFQDYFAARWLRSQAVELPEHCPQSVREFMIPGASK